MKAKDITFDVYNECISGINNKKPKFKTGDLVRISECKNI